MRRSHFAAFAPHCPVCLHSRGTLAPLDLAVVRAEQDGDVTAGILHCPAPECRHEYPIVDGIPVIVPELRRHLADRGVELLLRDDLDPVLRSLLGDALGPDSWLDGIRQTVSTYAWDAYADLDPDEPGGEDDPQPGAARRCLARLLDLAGGPLDASRALDLGCGAGRTSFELAESSPGALVLGLDTNLALLRLARRVAATGDASYDRRRIGLVYDARRIATGLGRGSQVDFWCCDAAALPFAPGAASLAVGLNLLDCVPRPRDLLAELARVVRPGGALLLATPFDWSARATPVETWIGGHSARGEGAGAGEPFLHALVTAGAHAQSVAGLSVLGTADLPWQTRLHDRAAVSYRTFLMALSRT